MKPISRYETELLQDMLKDIDDDMQADLDTVKVLVKTADRLNNRTNKNLARFKEIEAELERRKKEH